MWGLSTLLVGAVYGWLTPGVHNKSRVLWTGLGLGLIVAIVFTLLGAAIDSSALPLGTGVRNRILAVLVMTLTFALGVWAGDLLQRRRTTVN